MEDDEEIKGLLKVLIGVTARVAFPEEKLRQIVAPMSSSGKYVEAYNLCDGTRSQAEIAREAGIDKGNLSKAVNRWLVQGVVFSVGSSSEPRLIHVYPLMPNLSPKP